MSLEPSMTLITWYICLNFLGPPDASTLKIEENESKKTETRCQITDTYQSASNLYARGSWGLGDPGQALN